MSQSLLPIFLTTTLGAGALTVGLIDGIANLIGALVKPVSGRLSDGRHGRKKLALLGYGIAAAARPIMALATNINWVLSARVIDRVGKGIRGAPRDALIADIAAPEDRTRAYGVRKSLDSLGAFIGPLLAILLLALFDENIRAVLWAAVIPGIIAVLVLAVFVREPRLNSTASEKKASEASQQGAPVGFGGLGSRFRQVALLGALVALARSSEAFLLLNAARAGLDIMFIPAVIFVMAITYSACAMIAASVVSAIGGRKALTLSMLCLSVAYGLMAASSTLPAIFAAALLWGVHMGISQPLLATLAAAAVSAKSRGTAFGLFGLAASIAGLVAAVFAGFVWDSYGGATMMAAFAAVSCVVFPALWILLPSDDVFAST